MLVNIQQNKGQSKKTVKSYTVKFMKRCLGSDFNEVAV